MSVLLAGIGAYIQLMRTVTEYDRGHFPSLRRFPVDTPWIHLKQISRKQLYSVVVYTLSCD